MEYENWVRSELDGMMLVPFFRQGKLRQGGVVVGRDCTLELAASDTQESSLRSSRNSYETYNEFQH